MGEPFGVPRHGCRCVVLTSAGEGCGAEGRAVDAPVGSVLLVSMLWQPQKLQMPPLVAMALGDLWSDWICFLAEVFLGLGWPGSLIGVWPEGLARGRVGVTLPGPGHGASLLALVGTVDCLTPSSSSMASVEVGMVMTQLTACQPPAPPRT